MKNRNFLCVFFIAGALIFILAGVSLADSSCKEDIAKFCSDVQPGNGRIFNCLNNHTREISQACYDSLSSKESEYKNAPVRGVDKQAVRSLLEKSCSEDMAKFCPDAQRGKTISCLQLHYKEISDACFDCLDKIKDNPNPTNAPAGAPQGQSSDNASPRQQP